MQISWLQLASLQSWGWKTFWFAWILFVSWVFGPLCCVFCRGYGESNCGVWVGRLGHCGGFVWLFREHEFYRYWIHAKPQVWKWLVHVSHAIRPFFSNKLISSPSRTRTERSFLFSDLIVQFWGIIIEIKINHQLHTAAHVTFCYSFAPITPLLWSASSTIECTVSWRD